MKIELEIEENDYEWEENSYIKVCQPSKQLLEIQANKAGLISLAKQILTLAYATDSTFMIHHWAEIKSNLEKDYFYGDLEEGSLQLSIVKVENEGRKMQ